MCRFCFTLQHTSLGAWRSIFHLPCFRFYVGSFCKFWVIACKFSQNFHRLFSWLYCIQILNSKYLECIISNQIYLNINERQDYNVSHLININKFCITKKGILCVIVMTITRKSSSNHNKQNIDNSYSTRPTSFSCGMGDPLVFATAVE